MQKISARQRSILAFIARHTQEAGFPPTIREIGEAVGLRSTCSVFRHLETLERLGFVRKQRFGNRAIEILKGTDYATEPRRTVNVPLIREPCSRESLLAKSNIAEVYAFSRNLLHEDNCFLIMVQDETSAPIGITQGDLAMVHPQATFRDGDLVAVLQDDRFVVRHLSQKDVLPTPWERRETNPPDALTRKPTNAPDGEVLGKVIMIIRRLNDSTAD